jgi:hypothetical protein
MTETRECDIDKVVEAWAGVSEAREGLIETGAAGIDGAISGLERSLEQLSDACDITEGDLRERGGI